MFLSRQERLPCELFYEFIIPHLLSWYLHQLIVHDEKQAWNPFTQLPLVCRHFRKSCRTLIRTKIFDADLNAPDATATEDIRKILKSTKKLWRENRKIPIFIPPKTLPVKSTYQTLMSSQSLIQIYICAGIAKYFYTVDVLPSLCLDRLWTQNWINADEDHDDIQTVIPTDFRFRPYKMEDDRMHRVFLPFTCAMMLCDSINHDALASTMADYLAKKSVTYGTEPLLLKHAQDLEMNVARRHGLPLTIWSKWTLDTLRLINDRRDFLTSLQSSGKLVYKHIRSSDLTRETIIKTRILDVLKVVSLVDWGNDTENIRRNARLAVESLMEAYKNGMAESDETELERNDEYFSEEEGGKKVYFSELFNIVSRKVYPQ